MTTGFLRAWLVMAVLLLFSLPALAEEAEESEASKPKTRILIVAKALSPDPKDLQERGVKAVWKLSHAVRSFHPGSVVDALAEAVMTKQQFWRGEVREKVTGSIFRERLQKLAKTAGPRDTVLIYTHTHGRKAGFEEAQPLGGLVLDHPIRRPEHRGTLLWDAYADLLLKIPAKNVVVLTMSCFSGGLIEYLNTPKVRKRWKDRRRKEGRSFAVLTSQNKDLMSPPIVKHGEVVNPFTYAAAKALSGEADGFCLRDGKQAEPRGKDGKLTLGEVMDYILHFTEKTVSEFAGRRNIAKPKAIGSFDRADVLFVRGRASGQSEKDENGDERSKRGRERFKQLFARLDKNGDSMLTPGELGIPDLFAKLDTNGDGKLHLDEALAALDAVEKK